MKLAVFTDIHGNLEALKAIINDINSKNVDEIICLGDTIGLGSESKECLDLIIENNIKMVLGNHELCALYGTDIDSSINSNVQKEHYKWIRESLTTKEIDFLKKCPLYYECNISYNNIIKKSCEKGININYVNTGSKFNLKNDFSVTCIHPDNGYIYSDANDYSAVYILKKDDFKMLLTGDIEKKAEDNILKNKDVREELKNMTVLKAAHHGSASSSGEEFIKLVNPEVTVISCGINNRYGHPKESTLKMLKKYNSDIYVTKECGQVMIRYTKDKFYVKTL